MGFGCQYDCHFFFFTCHSTLTCSNTKNELQELQAMPNSFLSNRQVESCWFLNKQLEQNTMKPAKHTRKMYHRIARPQKKKPKAFNRRAPDVRSQPPTSRSGSYCLESRRGDLQSSFACFLWSFYDFFPIFKRFSRDLSWIFFGFFKRIFYGFSMDFPLVASKEPLKAPCLQGGKVTMPVGFGIATWMVGSIVNSHQKQRGFTV